MRLEVLTEHNILITLIALALLLLSAYIFGTLIEKIKGHHSTNSYYYVIFNDSRLLLKI